MQKITNSQLVLYRFGSDDPMFGSYNKVVPVAGHCARYLLVCPCLTLQLRRWAVKQATLVGSFTSPTSIACRLGPFCESEAVLFVMLGFYCLVML